MPLVSKIARYIDEYLRIHGIDDWPNALNGLQIENSGRVTKIGAAVDVSTRVLAQAARSEEHTSELQSQSNLVCRLLLEKKKKTKAGQCNRNYVTRHTIEIIFG